MRLLSTLFLGLLLAAFAACAQGGHARHLPDGNPDRPEGSGPGTPPPDGVDAGPALCGAPGQICCADAECDEGASCVADRCVRCGGAFQRCCDGACGPALVCVTGVCESDGSDAGAADAGPADAGAEDAGAADAGDPGVADPPATDAGSSDGGAAPPSCSPEGAACATADDCCRGSCEAGACAEDPGACIPDGDPCAAAADCCSGECTRSRCGPGPVRMPPMPPN